LPALAAAIHDASSGNPLFVSEVVRLLRAEDRLQELEDGGALVVPRGIDQVIARRLEHLSDECRMTLSLAAVVGREFDVGLLSRAAAAPGDELLAHIEHARAARVVDSAGGDRLRFSHDLVRSALYAGVGAVQRRRMHESVANALESFHSARSGSVVAELAYHYSAALPGGDPAKAIRYLTIAGEAAAELSSFDEAASHYARAIEIGKAHGAEPAELCELNLRVAEQLVLDTDIERAKVALAEAEALVSEAPDRGREGRLAVARVHLGLGDALAFGENEVSDAIELFRELGDPASEARAWGALVLVCFCQSAWLKGGESAQAMLDCAIRAGSAALVGEALRAIAFSLVLGPVPISEAIPRTRALLDETDDPMTRARILRSIASLEGKRGHFDEARSLFAEALATAPASQRAAFRSYVESMAAQMEFQAGNHRRAEEAARASCADMQSRGLVRYLSTELCFLVDPLVAQGKLEEAAAQLERAAPLAASDNIDALFRQARSRARLELARGNLDAAEAAARESMGYVLEEDVPDEIAQCSLVLAEVLRAADREAQAREAALSALRVSQARENAIFTQKASQFLASATAPTVARRPRVA
jgi:tetratricopeptide (TPR) repeat protein